MADVIAYPKFQSKIKALKFGASAKNRDRKMKKYRAEKGKYWSMDLMDYVPTWVLIYTY